MLRHFHIHLWLLQYIHNALAVPEDVTKVRGCTNHEDAYVAVRNQVKYLTNKTSELKYVDHEILEVFAT